MAVLKLSTPGVYVQEISTLPPSVAEVETAIPAFIGYTEKADRLVAGDLVMLANKIGSLGEFEQFYGGPQIESKESISITVKDSGSNQYEVIFGYDSSKRSKYSLYYSIKHFYDNGGGTCYIVAADTFKTPSSVSKEKLKSGLEVIADVDEVTLLVIPEAPVIDQTDGGAAYKEVVNAMISQAYDLKDRFALVDPYQVTPKNSADPNGDIDADVLIIRNATLTVSENRYAAAYYPNVTTTYEFTYDFDNLEIDNYDLVGVATPSVAGYGAGKKMSDLGSGSVLYTKISDALKKEYVTLPPSPALAGLYTRVDTNKGVWKAPANEALLSVVQPSLGISSREQESLNVDSTSGKSINVIRTFPGYGTLVWGARTLNGNDNEWRYISVRRFFNMVEESVRKSSQWAVFEPNTIDTWVKMEAMIRNYLFLKWREGALAGAKEEQAFYVKVGLGSTMTSTDVLEGRMNVEIGMAVARPAEFIVLKFSQMVQQS
ncbi:MAG: phage tail sheath family protein [Chlorobium sp.]|nr:MAG: phage tail sheath family protein [Chlorobium sp.]